MLVFRGGGGNQGSELQLRRVLGRLAVGVVGRGNGPNDDKRESSHLGSPKGFSLETRERAVDPVH